MERRDFIKVSFERQLNPLMDYDEVVYTFENIYLVKSKITKLYGLINDNFKVIIPCEYEKRQFYDLINSKKKEQRNGNLEIRIVSKQDGMAGYTNNVGKLIIPRIFQKAYPFSENLGCIKYNSTWGYINLDGTFKINPIYENARSFSEGLAPVKLDSKWRFIDYEGETAIPRFFDEASGFHFGYALVRSGSDYSLIDKTGKELTQQVQEIKYLEINKTTTEKDESDFLISEIPSDAKNCKILEYLSIITSNDKEIIVQESSLDAYVEALLMVESQILEEEMIKAKVK